MTGLSMGSANVLAEKFPWSEYEIMVDLGTNEGLVPRRVAEENQHIEAFGLDLPKVKNRFEEFTGSSPASDRIEFVEGDFFEDEKLPEADIYVLGHILHDWGLEDKKTILSKVYHALNDGGSMVVYGTLIDEDRSENDMGLLMSLNMLVETPEGFDYTPSQCIEWLEEIGFSDPDVENLPGPESMVIAQK